MDFMEYEDEASFSWDAGMKYKNEHTTILFTNAALKRLRKTRETKSSTYIYLAYHGLHDDEQALTHIERDVDQNYGNLWVNHVSNGESSINLGPDQIEVEVMDFMEYEDEASFSWDAGMKYKNEHTTILFTNAALKRLRKTRETKSSTYIYLAYHGLHDDEQALTHIERDVDLKLWKSLDEFFNYTDRRLNFGKALSILDSEIGLILDYMKEEMHRRDYLIVFHSDNGGSPCARHICGNNMPYRGMKFSDFEGALKVPAFMYSPTLFGKRGIIGRKYRGLMHHVDWIATFLQVAGVPDYHAQLNATTFDSVGHWNALLDVAVSLKSEKYAVRDTIYFSLSDDSYVIRQDNFKLIYGYENDTWYSTKTEYEHLSNCYSGLTDYYLFDLDLDPTETNNLFYHSEYRHIREKLLTAGRNAYSDQAIVFEKTRVLNDDSAYYNSSLAYAW
eukprot:CAMPEP_0197323278 /NCGR_PEP_ID=MMETSP0891-20130614/70416_1 /TAXON_ID=44058 ORGANISM="Aureoumbra lagunensis, Strain CCMP1510" /NCGR_SAMPLE_ID=MMETSP0891 /ASSEMBLY_ACC=CAM_ASM_000534 /LENGTH=445 /DNA_ID=CAMNT_0042815875 /DNA_START=894 /DNA_END=2229 /DNA_ORIENTATION=+